MFAAFAASRLGWAADPARVFAIPDVMTGLAEVIQALTPPGAAVVLNPPVYPPFWFRFGFSGRRIVEAPLARSTGGRYDLDPDALDRALSQPEPAPTCCAARTTRPAACGPGRSCIPWPSLPAARVALVVDEIHAPLVLPGAGSCRSCPSTTR